MDKLSDWIGFGFAVVIAVTILAAAWQPVIAPALPEIFSMLRGG